MLEEYRWTEVAMQTHRDQVQSVQKQLSSASALSPESYMEIFRVLPTWLNTLRKRTVRETVGALLLKIEAGQSLPGKR